MCQLCIEIVKGKMTAKEIALAYAEIGGDNPHAGDILTVLENSGRLDEVQDAIIDLAVEYNEQGD